MLSWLMGNGLLVNENYNAIVMYFNSFHRLSMMCSKMDYTMEG